MKSRLVSLLLVMVILTVSFFPACSSNAPADDGKVIELTYSNFFAATHYNSVLAEQWIQEIEKRTNGKVNITYYPGGTLATGPKTYDGVVQGICDIGMSVLSYTPGRFPSSELVDLPHSYPSGWVATQVANDFYNEFKPAEFNDVHVLYFHGHGPGVIFSASKPVRTLTDLNGMTIRGTGIGVEIVQALGAQGVGKSQAESYELLSKGLVDGSYSPREVLKGWNNADVVKYVTSCTDVGNTSMMFVAINKDKWSTLPANVQKVITDVSKEWIQKHGQVWNYYDQAGIELFLSKGQGRELIILSKDEMAKWVQKTVPLMEKAIADRNAKGLPATQIDKYIAERVKYWSGRTPKDTDVKTYVETEVANWKAGK